MSEEPDCCIILSLRLLRGLRGEGRRRVAGRLSSRPAAAEDARRRRRPAEERHGQRHQTPTGRTPGPGTLAAPLFVVVVVPDAAADSASVLRRLPRGR